MEQNIEICEAQIMQCYWFQDTIVTCDQEFSLWKPKYLWRFLEFLLFPFGGGQHQKHQICNQDHQQLTSIAQIVSEICSFKFVLNSAFGTKHAPLLFLWQYSWDFMPVDLHGHDMLILYRVTLHEYFECRWHTFVGNKRDMWSWHLQ
jgi:hypothetical protein